MEDITALTTKLYIKHSSEVLYSLLAETVANTQYVEDFNGAGAYAGNVLGAIDLRFGVGSFTLQSGILPNPIEEYTYRVVFETNSSDALLTKRNQLLIFGEADITVIYDEVY